MAVMPTEEEIERRKVEAEERAQREKATFIAKYGEELGRAYFAFKQLSPGDEGYTSAHADLMREMIRSFNYRNPGPAIEILMDMMNDLNQRAIEQMRGL